MTVNRRAQWTCPNCETQMLEVDRPRDAAGKLRKHCGCSTGMHAGWGRSREAGAVKSHTAEYSRLARIRASKGHRPARHDGHVKAWKRWCAERPKSERDVPAIARQSKQEKDVRRRARERTATDNLSNGYVAKRLKKNTPILKGVKLPQALIDLERARLLIVRQITRMDR